MKRRRSTPKDKGPARPIKYSMRLYVTGATGRSTRAITNLRRLCELYLPGQYELTVIDMYQQPALAREGQVIAAPTLIKYFPLPLRRFIGDMSNTENILTGLQVHSMPARKPRGKRAPA
jgi:circadian clock protein KaiB